MEDIVCPECNTKIDISIVDIHHMLCEKPVILAKPVISKPVIEEPGIFGKIYAAASGYYNSFTAPVSSTATEVKKTVVQVIDIWTPIQTAAIEYSFKKSKIFARNTTYDVEIMWGNNNFNILDLPKVINLIKSAPTIIHFKLEKLYPYLNKDNRYQNLFETGSGGGCLDQNIRSKWEEVLFNKLYTPATPRERVKYGCLNLYNSQKGVQTAYGYGDSYIVLKDNLKNRTSFVVGDSSAQEIHIATFESCEHILLHLNVDTITNMIKIVNGTEPNNTNYMYVEAQIHGDIVFTRDVEKLILNKRHKKDANMLKSIKDIPYEFY